MKPVKHFGGFIYLFLAISLLSYSLELNGFNPKQKELKK